MDIGWILTLDSVVIVDLYFIVRCGTVNWPAPFSSQWGNELLHCDYADFLMTNDS